MWYRNYRKSQKFDPRTNQGYFEFDNIRNPSLEDDIVVTNDVDDYIYNGKIFGTLWAKYGDNILGRLEYILNLDSKEVHLAEVKVRSIYQNMGVARTLFQHLQKIAKEDRYKKIVYVACHPSTLSIGSSIFGKPSTIRDIDTKRFTKYDSALDKLNSNLEKEDYNRNDIPGGYVFDIMHQGIG